MDYYLSLASDKQIRQFLNKYSIKHIIDLKIIREKNKLFLNIQFDNYKFVKYYFDRKLMQFIISLSGIRYIKLSARSSYINEKIETNQMWKILGIEDGYKYDITFSHEDDYNITYSFKFT